MKAIILSAGQGKRLLPLTAEIPKCLLPIRGKKLIEWQIDALHRCGVHPISVVTGYHSEKVDEVLRRSYEPGHIQGLFNPAYAVTDNLVSCWAARHESGDFILLNGDTLFETAVLNRLLESPDRPVTVVGRDGFGVRSGAENGFWSGRGGPAASRHFVVAGNPGRRAPPASCNVLEGWGDERDATCGVPTFP